MIPAPTDPKNRAWVMMRRRRSSPALVRVFCLPHAGASGAIYARWQPALPEWMEIVPVEYPGRLSRLDEEPYKEFAPLVADMCTALTGLLDKPYIVFGNSMGALLSFELVRSFRRRGLKAPLHLFVSACSGPRKCPDRAPDLAVSDREFLRIVQLRYGALPVAATEDPDMRAHLLTTLRADWSVLDSYRYGEERPLACPITALGGAEDKSVSASGLDQWRAETVGPFTSRVFAGGHLFLQESMMAIRTALLDVAKVAVANNLGQQHEQE